MNPKDFPPVEYDTPYDRPWQAPQQLRGGPGRGGSGNPLVGVATTNPAGFALPNRFPIIDANHYAKLTEGNLSPGVAGASNTLAPFLLETDVRRNFLGVRNASASGGANIYIGFGQIASPSSWLMLLPGQSILFDVVVPQNDIYATADAALAVLTYAVSTIPA